jgi:GntR family transcriptional regulator, transcriptional repressor for pyruvate dehydrogenase complex
MEHLRQVTSSSDRHIDAFRPIRQRAASDEVVAVLVNAINGGLYRPGDLLPRERDLSERLEVSRTVVSEAIAVLRRAGVVTVRRGRSGGVTVTSLANLGRVIVNLGGETQATLQSVLEARRPLEIEAALLAGERATDDDLLRLRTLVDSLPGLKDAPTEFQSLDVRFHLTVAEVARSPVLHALLQSVLEHLMATLAGFPVGRVELGPALSNQRATLEAISTRDPARISSAVDEHLATLEERFLGRRLSHPSGPPAES